MFNVNPVPLPGASLRHDLPVQNVRKDGANTAQPAAADAPRGYVHPERVEKVLACRYDALAQPLLLPKYVAYGATREYTEQLKKTAVGWNAVDIFREGPDGTMMRLPMKMPSDTLYVLGLGSVPVPAVEGAVPDPSRRVAGLGRAYGEYRMRDEEGDMVFLLNGRPAPSILPDRGVYYLGEGKWLVSRQGNEDPMSACLRMVQMEGWPKDYVRQMPAPNCEDRSQLADTSESPSLKCLRMMALGAQHFPLQGQTHDAVMAKMAEVLAERRCGILFTKGALRVVDEVRALRDLPNPPDPPDDRARKALRNLRASRDPEHLAKPVYAITLRDPETCSSRRIRDHLEFWQDQASSPKVTPVPAGWVHGADDVLLVPPEPVPFDHLGSLV